MQDNLDKRPYVDLEEAVALAQYTVYKRYLTELDQYPLIPPPKSLMDEKADKCVNLFRLKEFTVKKGEDINQKLSTVYNASMALGCTLVVLIDVSGIGAPADIYLGVRNSGEDEFTRRTSFATLSNSLKSNFPGTKTDNINQSEVPEKIDEIFGSYIKNISSVTCVASSRDKTKTESKSFIQGIERFIDTMKGYNQPYTAMFIAEPISVSDQAEIRSGYESIYSTLSAFRKSVWSYNENESNSVMENLSEGVSNAITEGTSHTQGYTKGLGASVGINGSRGRESSNSTAYSSGINSPTTSSRIGQALPYIAPIAGKALSTVAGAVACVATAGNPTVVCAASKITDWLVEGATKAGEAIGAAMQGSSVSESITSTIVSGVSKSLGVHGDINGHYDKNKSDSDFKSNSRTTNSTKTTGTSSVSGKGRTLQIENVNKPIDEMLKRIDEQLKRSRECEDYGAYNCGAYFLSNQPETSVIAANTYRALMLGEGSSIESGAINIWSESKNPDTVKNMKEYLKRFVHPTFFIPLTDSPKTEDDIITYSPGTIVSGLELPLHLGIPTKSVYGLPVIEHAKFGRNIASRKVNEDNKYIETGRIFHMGNVEKSTVQLDINSLTMHTFITGSTGTGKSNFIYQMLEKLECYDKKFLVIEPAKGEYKNVYGGKSDVTVYGTNPRYAELLHINPFSFPEHISVLEHIDRLVEIFNACWPMYAAMPAVLKDAIERIYRDKGWIFSNPTYYSHNFPTFENLVTVLPKIMNNSMYSADTKNDYLGALITRIKSLTNGINGEIFCSENEISNEKLFDENVIVDISRVGSVETKALIMGIVIMKLQEYRMKSDQMNEELKHVTVIEEAHNLLRKTSFSQSQESSNLQGKSVEMITNAIAEMRTYGEGFIIADQAPNLLDEAVIRNTNTKVIFRLPNEADCELVGKSAALNDEQITELAKLPAFVAAVYQNNWLEAVLCKSDKFTYQNKYKYQMKDYNVSIRKLMTNIFSAKEKVALSKAVKKDLEEWISGLSENPEIKGFLYKSIRNEPLKEPEKMSIAYDLFNGCSIAYNFAYSSNEDLSMRFMDNQIRNTFCFDDNDAVVEYIKNYIFMEMCSNEELAENFKRYSWFESEGGIR